MEDLIFTTLVLVGAGFVHTAVLRAHEPNETRLLTLGFAAHVVSAFAQILIYTYYYRGGDMLTYYTYGVPISQALRNDFSGLFPLTMEVFFHEESRLPFELIGEGSTGTMQMVAVWLLFLLGDSFVAVSVFVAVLSYLAKVVIYRALRAEFAVENRSTILFATMLVPSAVFWTSAMLKEPVMMVFFGPLFASVRWFLEGRRFAAATVLAVVAGTFVWFLKPYVLISFAACAGLWLIWHRVLRQRGSIVVKPVYLALGLSLGVGAFTAAERVLPKSEGQSISSAMTYQRRMSAMEQGGSNFYLEERGLDAETVAEDASIARQLALAPLALVTAFFRPFLFEARNVVQAINALETTWLLVLFFQVLRRQRWASLASRVTASPTLMFCFAFSVVLAVGTGLATANLGTLSRYRAPMMPFFVLLLLMLRKPSGDAAVRALSPDAAKPRAVLPAERPTPAPVPAH